MYNEEEVEDKAIVYDEPSSMSTRAKRKTSVQGIAVALDGFKVYRNMTREDYEATVGKDRVGE